MRGAQFQEFQSSGRNLSHCLKRGKVGGYQLQHDSSRRDWAILAVNNMYGHGHLTFKTSKKTKQKKKLVSHPTTVERRVNSGCGFRTFPTYYICPENLETPIGQSDGVAAIKYWADSILLSESLTGNFNGFLCQIREKRRNMKVVRIILEFLKYLKLFEAKI